MYTESHTADGHHSGALRKEMVKYGSTDSSRWYTESHRTDGHRGWSTTDRSGEMRGTQ